MSYLVSKTINGKDIFEKYFQKWKTIPNVDKNDEYEYLDIIMIMVHPNIIDDAMSFFVFSSGHRNQVTCSSLGGFSKPRAEVIQLLDSGLM